MKKIIRSRTFETNSSSSHSLCLSEQQDFKFNEPKELEIKFGEFGWGYDVLTDPELKLSYLFTAAQYLNGWEDISSIKYIKEFRDKLQHMLDGTNVYLSDIDESIMYNNELGCPFGYIDHQSVGEDYASGEVYYYALESTENLLNYLFNNEVQVIIDNDNH